MERDQTEADAEHIAEIWRSADIDALRISGYRSAVFSRSGGNPGVLILKFLTLKASP
jgi:hypothetical protein